MLNIVDLTIAKGHWKYNKNLSQVFFDSKFYVREELSQIYSNDSRFVYYRYSVFWLLAKLLKNRSEKFLITTIENKQLLAVVIFTIFFKNITFVLHNNHCFLQRKKGTFKKFLFASALKRINFFVLNHKLSVFYKKEFGLSARVMPIPLSKRFYPEEKLPNQYILIPNRNNQDEEFIRCLIKNKKFIDYMSKNRFSLFIFSKVKFTTPMIKIVCFQDHLSHDDYFSIIRNAYCSIIKNNSSYLYRESSIATEHVELGTRFIMHDDESFENFEKYFNKKINFKEISELVLLLQKIPDYNDNIDDVVKDHNAFIRSCIL